MRNVLFAGMLVAAATAVAAPGQKDPVAEGYMDWDGVVPKNFLAGRLITPSDLRHRAVVYVEVDANAFTNDKVPNYSSLASLAALPSAHQIHWETQELPREKILVVSVRNLGKNEAKEFPAVIRPPKGADAAVSQKYTGWTENRIPFYRDLKPVGGAEIADENLPYVAVYGGTGTEPLYKKEKWTSSDLKNVKAAITEAVGALEPWKAPLGVEESQFFKKIQADFAKGKSTQSLMTALKGGIKSKNPEQAKEAQIMFDALNQYKTDLMLRIQLEFHTAPARAYYDYQTLVKLFPGEKKNLQAIDAKLKANKEIGALGKVFEKIMLWSRDDYVCKNKSEATKNIQELNKYKKILESLANSQNAQLQGEAMLFQAQIDTLIDIMPTKVPQK